MEKDFCYNLLKSIIERIKDYVEDAKKEEKSEF